MKILYQLRYSFLKLCLQIPDKRDLLWIKSWYIDLRTKIMNIYDDKF